MGHFSIENQTPFASQVLALSNEEVQPILVAVVKATYLIGDGELRLAPTQVPVNMAGELWGKAEDSSYKFEPECAFVKPATDVVLVGHAHARAPGTSELLVDLQVGSLRKTVRVLGERVWFKSLGQISMTKPLTFERIPLTYERAFGGWDRTDPEQCRCEMRNPVGVGFRASARHFEEGLRLPDLEDPQQPLRSFGQVVLPAGFGFISPQWQPRATFGGTYDAAWRKTRNPLLPKDFDRRFFNAASPGLVAAGYLRGNEPVLIDNASPRGRLSFRLPGQLAPRVTVVMAGAVNVIPEMRLDTIILETDHGQVMMLWRGHILLPDAIQDVRTVFIRTEGAPVRSA